VPPYIYAIFHFYFKFGIGNPKNGALTPGRVLLCMRARFSSLRNCVGVIGESV
jgi:hypothetical protein